MIIVWKTKTFCMIIVREAETFVSPHNNHTESLRFPHNNHTGRDKSTVTHLRSSLSVIIQGETKVSASLTIIIQKVFVFHTIIIQGETKVLLHI